MHLLIEAIKDGDYTGIETYMFNDFDSAYSTMVKEYLGYAGANDLIEVDEMYGDNSYIDDYYAEISIGNDIAMWKIERI